MPHLLVPRKLRRRRPAAAAGRRGHAPPSSLAHTLRTLLSATPLVVAVAACRATLVTPPGRSLPSRQTQGPADSTRTSAPLPTNESSRPGVIKYLNQGTLGVVEKRREDAYRRMSKACGGGAYAIDQEWPHTETTWQISLTEPRALANFWYIRFHCEGS